MTTLCPVSRDNKDAEVDVEIVESEETYLFGCPECRSSRVGIINTSVLIEEVTGWDDAGNPTSIDDKAQPSEYAETGDYHCLDCGADFTDPVDLNELTEYEQLHDAVKQVTQLVKLLHKRMDMLMGETGRNKLSGMKLEDPLQTSLTM